MSVQTLAVLDNQKLYFIHPFIYSFFHPLIHSFSKHIWNDYHLPRTYKHCAKDVSREGKEGRHPRKIYFSESALQSLFLYFPMTIQWRYMVKLCNLKTTFHKVPPFWLNKKQDFSTEVLCPFAGAVL